MCEVIVSNIKICALSNGSNCLVCRWFYDNQALLLMPTYLSNEHEFHNSEWKWSVHIEHNNEKAKIRKGKWMSRSGK